MGREVRKTAFSVGKFTIAYTILKMFLDGFHKAKKNQKKFKKSVDKTKVVWYNVQVVAREQRKTHGSIAQLGEHLPYKQRVIGSSPIVSTIQV